MKRLLVFILISVVFLQGVYCQIPAGYYDGASGLSGDALKSALNDIIDGHTELSYTAVKDALRETDEDPNNSSNVICLYTGWSYGKYDFGNGSEDWNREHTWSKSHGDFGNNPPAGTDLHHLRPTDASVNSAKGNRDFDIGVTQYIDGSGATDCYTDTDIWEPRDAVKGDVARMIFYMATRYEGENGEVDLEVVDYINTAGSSYEPYYGKLSTLLQWHSSDPVDSWEINRNNIIYSNYQGNRNPYIDHPEYVNLIWGGGVLPEPSNHVVSFISGNATSSSISITWDDNDGANVADKFLLMINTTGSFTTPTDGIENSDDTDISDGVGQVNVNHGDEAYTFSGLTPATNYYFEIYPFSNFGTDIDYKTDGSIPTTNTTTLATGINTFLVISEVADPSDSYQSRFVELYNAGSTTIDFDAEIWYLCRQANGGPSSWACKQLEGAINSNDTYVVAYSSSTFLSSYGFSPQLGSGLVTGNGNDGYFLYSGGDHASGTLVDAYGIIDQDGSGEAWEYLDSKAVRKRLDTIPSQVWEVNQWVINSTASVADMTPNWHHITMSWSGAQSTAWGNKDNWEVGTTTSNYDPDAGCKVIISNTVNSPVISTEASADKLELEPNAVLSINSGTLKLGH